MPRRFYLLFCVWMLCWSMAPSLSFASTPNFSTLRDDETEAYLKEMATPLLEKAGLSPEAVRFYIVNNPVRNAFVMGGQNIFIHTGLIWDDRSPDMLAGVIAHEIGHITGGHLARKQNEAEKAGWQVALGYALALGSGLLGADPGVAVGWAGLGQHVATRGFLKHSRLHESAADQVALDLLEQVGASPAGLIRLMEDFAREQVLSGIDANPYLQTHPLSRERVATMRAALAASKEQETPSRFTQTWGETHVRIIAKLRGFLEEPARVLKAYEGREDFEATTARAVATHRLGDKQAALAILKPWLNARPEDAYLIELAGQIAYEHGDLAYAEQAYRQAHHLAPKAPLIRLMLARILLQKTPPNPKEARQYLRPLKVEEPYNAQVLHELARAYHLLGERAHSHLHLAEKHLLRRELDLAHYYLQQAEKAPGSTQLAIPIAHLKTHLAHARAHAKSQAKKRR